VLLAYITGALARRRKWESPSFLALTGIYAVGILSHIILDLCTSFGTMIWSPLEWTRPAWDILFIVDFTFSAILLVPQWLAWAYSDTQRAQRRASTVWVIFTMIPLVVSRIGETVGAPISSLAILIATVACAVVFLLPLIGNCGVRLPYAAWNRAGLAAAAIYVLLAVYAHQTALTRVQQFAAQQKLQVQAIGALPLPPSLWHWSGLVRAPRGVYEIHMDVSDNLFKSKSAQDAEVIQRTYYPDAFPNTFIELAERLPQVQEVMWFARFPVTRFHMEGNEAVVEISDLRFASLRRDRVSSFTYRVRFAENGDVLSQGWLR
jgi:LexA-binding, inner membrane-associated putative hydrolase